MNYRDSIRQGHLIYGAGVGGLTILRNGVSVICAGLDYWFRKRDGRENRDVRNASELDEWRLKARLRVRSLRQPPAATERLFGSSGKDEAPAVVPFLRFPQWHVCPRCRALEHVGSRIAEPAFCARCRSESKKKVRLVQVPVVAACAAGHLDEFPWQRWIGCQCENPRLKLQQSGGAGLANLRVRCQVCGKSRPLQGALSEGSLGSCSGKRPWLLDAHMERCDHELKGVLRNASNTYFPDVVSSVYVPPDALDAPAALVEHLLSKDFSFMLGVLEALPEENHWETLERSGDPMLDDFDREQIEKALSVVLASKEAESIEASDEVDYRQREFDILRADVNHERLRVRTEAKSEYTAAFQQSGFDAVSLVESLVVTKALAGFGRILPHTGAAGSPEPGEILWKDYPAYTKRWLPAVQVRGEGILVTFDEARLQAWEHRDDVKRRYATVIGDAENARFAPHHIARFSPRLLLLHTFSHLLINKLVFHAGYSAASLSERIYCREPSPGESAMAGVLVYTAAGDTDGTLGGLVRLGQSGVLEGIVRDALESARWCSNDPVCMEAERQGPDGLNLAACHACAHVPETACEGFNVLMDRGAVVGTMDHPELGFFSATPLLDGSQQA